MAAFTHQRVDEELTGAWRIEWMQANGEPKCRERALWVFTPETLTIVDDNGTRVAAIVVNPIALPKELDTDFVLQSTGIYEIDGPTLRVCQAVHGMPRPTKFETRWGDLQTVSLLRQVEANSGTSPSDLHALLAAEFGPPTEYPERIEFDKDAEAFVADVRRGLWDKIELSPKEEAVYHVSWLMTEVNNGGFYQFFENSTGDNAIETVIALRTIGAIQTAALVETGCTLFPNGTPAKDSRQRFAQLEQFTLDQLETLRDLQERFYSRTEDLNVLLKQYWQHTS